MIRRPPRSTRTYTLFPYTTLFRSDSVDNVPDDADLIIRLETGTINRYLYAMLMPSSNKDQLLKPDLSKWNGKLIYYFRGGIGVGFTQGVLRMSHLSKDMRSFLEKGYAIVFSTANETANGYNVWMQEDTALRLKNNFVARYGEPLFTIGYGGSGGGLQQYLLTQNNPGAIIDGGVAIVAYPDMATQISYTLDCELTEYYFDELSSDRDFWLAPDKRTHIQGLAGNASVSPRLHWLDNLAHLLRFEWPKEKAPGNECNARWRGSVQMVNNPVFTPQYPRYSKQVRRRTFWTNWQDNRQLYGTNDQGRAPIPWSNEGVQYGLKALQEKAISPQQFLELNSRIGSWSAQQEMVQERYWHGSADSVLKRYNGHSAHNMTHGGDIKDIAPRTSGSMDAARAAYQSGSVFIGELSRPIIDIRPYMDQVLDIHHSWSALSARKRMQERLGNHDLQVIWLSELPLKPYHDAVYIMDEWLTRADANGGDYRAARPESTQDLCQAKDGEILHKGPDVWDGDWNGQADGECSKLMPFYQGTRNIAGEDISADVFFCALIPVEQAIREGFYGDYDMLIHQQRLEAIFPTGVCDYRLPDRARPTGL